MANMFSPFGGNRGFPGAMPMQSPQGGFPGSMPMQRPQGMFPGGGLNGPPRFMPPQGQGQGMFPGGGQSGPPRFMPQPGGPPQGGFPGAMPFQPPQGAMPQPGGFPGAMPFQPPQGAPTGAMPPQGGGFANPAMISRLLASLSHGSPWAGMLSQGQNQGLPGMYGPSPYGL